MLLMEAIWHSSLNPGTRLTAGFWLWGIDGAME